MKNIQLKFPILLVLLFTFNMTMGQEIEQQMNNSQKENYNYYIGQHKALKQTGHILLGAGAGLLIGGISMTDSSKNGATGVLMALFGVMSTIASVPVYIVAGAKKRKAKTYLEGGFSNMTNFNLNRSKYAAVSFKIDF